MNLKITPIIVGIAILFAGCSSSSRTDVSNTNSTAENSESSLIGLVGEFKPEYSACMPGLQDGKTTCFLTYFDSNNTDKIISEEYAEVFIVVDGKIFAADNDQGNDGASTVSDRWNPGETKRATTYFTVPTGSRIEKLFWANDPELSQAEFVVDIGLVANGN